MEEDSLKDDLDRVIAKYAGTPLCEMVSHKQAEYLGAVAKRGAKEALKAIGLNDPEATADIRDIRDMLRGLRVFKKAAWTTVAATLGRVMAWSVLIGIAALFFNGRNRTDIVDIFRP